MICTDSEFACDDEASVALLRVCIQIDLQGRQVIVFRAAICVSLGEMDGTISDQANPPAIFRWQQSVDKRSGNPASQWSRLSPSISPCSEVFAKASWSPLVKASNSTFWSSSVEYDSMFTVTLEVFPEALC